MVTHSENARVLLANRFSFHAPALFFARARLHKDRIDLSGWHLRGRYRRVIPLKSILQADALPDDGLLLWLASGETLRLRIRRPAAWKAAIEASAA